MFEICFALVLLFLASVDFSFTIRKLSKNF